MIKATFNQEQLKSISKKLLVMQTKIVTGLNAVTAEATQKYKEDVLAEIGTHDPTVTSTTAFGVQWPALSRGWIIKKLDTGGYVETWAYTGDIMQAVRIYGSFSTGNIFVGIDGGENPSAFTHAIRNEFGLTRKSGDIPARPLFMPLASDVWFDFKSDYGNLGNQYRKVITDAVKTWGT